MKQFFKEIDFNIFFQISIAIKYIQILLLYPKKNN